MNHFESLLQDLRYALRAMGCNPGFTAAIVLTLTLAIGANSAIDGVLFAAINLSLLRDTRENKGESDERPSRDLRCAPF